MFAISMIPLSKSIFILSLNPICCGILAFIFLKEKLSKPIIFCTIGACTGIYLLTLNTQEGGNADENPWGYFFIIIGAWLVGSLFIIMRFLNIYHIHVTVNSFMIGSMFVVQSIVVYFLKDGLINIEKYTVFDASLLTIHGFLSMCWIWCMFFATKYAQASVVSPIMNLENLFTVLVDIFFFQYHFINSDFIGMTILGICIIIPIILRYMYPDH
mmetsp:Transcript_4509/g.5174  ORF Transcript_4509/g.5174 Transcript_4509/m.5174 type:complete len:214 (+) Transcript_4509:147-788(+)